MAPSDFVQRFREAVSKNRRFLVISHQRPDGDAVGSSLAMALALKALGKEVEVWNDDAMPKKFEFLPGAELWRESPPASAPFDVVVSVDNANKKRLGRAVSTLQNAGLWINIDHHASNEGFGQLNLVDTHAPATGEVLYHVFKACDMPITREMAASLFVAISTDTGCFTYPATTADSFQIAAELVETGLNVGEISRQIYESYPLGRFLLMRRILSKAEFHADHRIAYSWITPADYRETGGDAEDSEGLIDHLRAIEPVVAAVLFEELADGKIRISLRSKSASCDVNRVAQAFGGGGHTLAAGARTQGAPKEVQARVLEELSKCFAK